MSDTSLRFDFAVGRDTATPHMAKVAAAAQAMGRSVQSSSRTTSREIFKVDNAFRGVARRWVSIGLILGGALIAVSGHAVAFTHAIWPMVGALAAVPAVAVGAAIGLGSLFGVFGGLFSALQRSGGGGSQLDAVAAATRRLELAQRSAVDAQRDLNDARAEAARRLADVSRELAAANLDERQAVLGVERARQRLRESRTSGDRLDRREAQLGLEQSVQTLEDVRLRIQDLKAEEADRSAKGVEGSDEVQEALQRQSDAVYELGQAQKALAQARTGGGGVDKAAEAYAKLAPAGRAVVDMLRSLGPAWRSVQQAIQQAALVNVAGDISMVSAALLAQRGHLVAVGAGWNTAFRGVAAALTSADLANIFGNTAVMAQHLGKAWQPFLTGFLSFVDVGSDFLPRLGMWVESLATRFQNWALAAQESGRMHAWIENAVAVAKDFGAIIRDISAAIGSIFSAGSGGPQYLANLAASAASFRESMASPEQQARLAEFFAVARDLGSALGDVLKALASIIVDSGPILKTFLGGLTLVGIALRFAADNVAIMNAVLPPLIVAFVAYKAISLAIQVATAAWTAAQWLLNAAMYANPIGLIILLVVALVAVFVLLWMKSEGFRNFFIGMWDHIWGFLKMIGAWFAGPFVDFFVNAWHFVERVFSWDNIVAGFKAGINFLIRAWNALDFSINIPGIPILGFSGFHVPDVIPDIPYLDTGGHITQTGLAVVHRGEEVTRAAQVRRGGGGGEISIRIELAGPAETQAVVKKMIRKIVRTDGGGNVQVAFGGA